MCEPKFKIGATLVRTKKGGTFDVGYVFEVRGVKIVPQHRGDAAFYLDSRGSWHGEPFVKPFITKDGQPPEETLESIDKKIEAVQKRHDCAETSRMEASIELRELREQRRKLNAPKVGDRYTDGSTTYTVTGRPTGYGRVSVDKEVVLRADVAVSWLSNLTKIN